MINKIREVRRSKGLTLDDVAMRCEPQTTAQTVGRLETGTRELTLSWIDRLSKALDVHSADLLVFDENHHVPLIAHCQETGVESVKEERLNPPIPKAKNGTIAIKMADDMGDYRRDDVLWLISVSDDQYIFQLKKDILINLNDEKFIFGKFVHIDGQTLHILPYGKSQSLLLVEKPKWIAVAEKLFRNL